MTKKKLLLGLLVFAFGVMITACGSKSNTSNTTNNNENTEEFPKDFADDTCDNCIRTYNGTLTIVNENLYLQAFGHISGGGLGGIDIGNSIFDNFIEEAILQPAAGIAFCGTRILITELFADAFNIDNVDATCEVSDLDAFTNNNGTFINNPTVLNNTTPAARIRVRYENGVAEQIEMTVDSNIDGRDDVEVFNRESSTVFVNNEQSLLLQNASGSLRFGTTQGELIGEFRD